MRLRWQIYPDILNGNTVKWSVDSEFMEYRRNIVGLKKCEFRGKVDYIRLV